MPDSGIYINGLHCLVQDVLDLTDESMEYIEMFCSSRKTWQMGHWCIKMCSEMLWSLGNTFDRWVTSALK